MNFFIKTIKGAIMEKYFLNNQNLTAEQELLILVSRLTFSKCIEERAIGLIHKYNINWFDFYKLALYHKVVTLSWYNLKKLSITYKLNLRIPKYLDELISYTYICLEEKNKLYQNEIEIFLFELKKRNICIIPVKGVYLIPNLYKKFGIRYSGDADFLIKQADSKSIEEVLVSLGYVQGYYNPSTKKLEKFSRAEKIKHKSFLPILAPFTKINYENNICPYFKFDFRHSLDDSLNTKVVDRIIESYETNEYVKPAHYLIHLCSHFYEEYRHALDIALSKDINIIKLCDIREYIIQRTKELDLDELLAFSKEYGLEKQLYLCLYILSIVYNDGYEDKLLANINLDNYDFINQYGENEKQLNKWFKKTIKERFFSCGNIDELDEIPLALRKISND